MSTFKVVVIGIFMMFAVVGVILFAKFGGTQQAAVPSVVVWGTLPATYVNDTVHDINLKNTVLNVTYVQKDEATFDTIFANGVASGQGPDLVIVPDDLLYQEENKIVPIGFQTFPERDFRDTFVDAADVFIGTSGIYAVPFAMDPMVMYWNRDILATAGISRPPLLWSELPDMATGIIQKTDTSTITRSMVPLGEYTNVTNAKGIIATLFFQSGNSITTANAQGVFSSTLDDRSNGANPPVAQAVDFYTSFSDPVKAVYSWNRSLPDSQTDFLAGNLAFYFGYASEIGTLRSDNPNLNFDVTEIPQADNAPKVTDTRIYGLAISKSSRNTASDIAAINLLTSANTLSVFTTHSDLPPVRRDLLATRPTDPYLDVFYTAAIQGKTWVDPDPTQTNQIFQDMIESVTAGQAQGVDVLTTAKQKIDEIFKTNEPDGATPQQ